MNEQLRYYGRKLVLPADEIKKICLAAIDKNTVDSIVDFGAGTLFWSRWLEETYHCPVYAVDLSYPKDRAPEGNMHFFNDIDDCLARRERFSMVWMSDVLHHLDPAFWERVKTVIYQKADIVVLKDINAEKRFGNFANRMHDKIINHETVHDVFPAPLKQDMEAAGYHVRQFVLPKLWYPHFMLLAQRGHLSL